MARRVAGWDALRAWRFIRASRDYRAAWKRRNPMPGLPERAPPGSGAGTGFPVRLQTSTDLAALRWGMLAWEDPYADLPLAPFWASAGVIDGRVTFDTPPLVRLAAEGGATLSGLRLGDGALMLRIEQPGRSMQLRFPAGTVFPDDGGLLTIREVVDIEDVWLGAPGGAGFPLPGRARGTTGTGNSCWRWKARRKGSPTARPRCGSGAPNGSRRNGGRAAGCTVASSAGAGAPRRSSISIATLPPGRRDGLCRRQ